MSRIVTHYSIMYSPQEVKKKESKTYLHRVAHSALRLVSIGALYLKNNLHQELSWTITFKMPNENLARILELHYKA